MTDDAPPVLRLSERRGFQSGALTRPRKPTEQYSGFGEYFQAEIEPGLRNPEPEVTLGHAALKRRR